MSVYCNFTSYSGFTFKPANSAGLKLSRLFTRVRINVHHFLDQRHQAAFLGGFRVKVGFLMKTVFQIRCSRAQRLQEYSRLHQKILWFWFFLSGPIQGNEHFFVSVFGSSTPAFNSDIRSPLCAQQCKMRTRGNGELQTRAYVAKRRL